jgi:Spx/MgsR family transcriptional regulator
MPSEFRIHLHVYGIANCDGCRAALSWLSARNVPHTFHDLRKEGLSEARLGGWLASAHAPYLINRRSTTWRKLTANEKRQADANPLPLLLEHPTLIKRPVITGGETILDIGFSPSSLDDYI